MSRIEDAGGFTLRFSTNHLSTGRDDKKVDMDHHINCVSRLDSGDLHTNHNHVNICDSTHLDCDIYHDESYEFHLSFDSFPCRNLLNVDGPDYI